MIKNMRAIPPWEKKNNQRQTQGPGSLIDRGGSNTIKAMPATPPIEIEKRLKKLETGVKQLSTPVVNDGKSWIPATEVLYIAYASALSNLGTDGRIPNQSDCTNFGYLPFTNAGVLYPFRGRLVSKSVYPSGDSTDYIWESTSTTITSSNYVRHYSKNDALLSAIGDPDNPGSGITWTSIAPATAIPGTAYWVADKFTIDGASSSWQIYPVKTGVSTNIGIISHTKSGYNKPTLNDATWKADVILAATANTGLAYSLHTELGFGAVVVITYDNGKLFGILREVGGTATWQVPADIVDGDLVVDGTIATDKISANAITGAKISSGTTITAGTGNNVGVLDGADSTYRIYAGHATPASAPFRVAQDGTVTIEQATSTGKLVIEGDVIKVYTTSASGDTLRVKLGNLS
tara:strand:+ start:2184 stop:3398 length:1215 start_codon:yes stop_codon:yes gene_type:complete